MVIPLTYSVKRTVDATIEPVTLKEARDWVGQSTHDDDAMLSRLISTARQKLERDTARALISQTWEMKLDNFHEFAKTDSGVNAIEFPVAPLLSVSTGGITYVNTTGGTSTWGQSANYEVDANRTPGVIFTKFGIDYPSDVRDVQNAVTITATLGYGATRSSVPEVAKQAILMQVDDYYCARGVDGPNNSANYASLVHSLRWGNYR